MEFVLMSVGGIGLSCSSLHESKMVKVESITRTHNSHHSLFLSPIIENGRSRSIARYDGSESFREDSINLLFGNSELAKELKESEATFPVATHLTLISSTTGRLMIETKYANRWQTSEDNQVDVFERLYELQETLPQNSIEFILSASYFEENAIGGHRSFMRFNPKGPKLVRNEGGSTRLEMTEMCCPGENWMEKWSGKTAEFFGYLSIHVKLELTAVIELYKRKFSGGPSTTEVKTATDMVILVGGNKDKEKAVKCHKSILSAMSPVFAAMFQADMLELKESTVEIVDLSEACIRALIDFAYRRDVEEPLKSSVMTLELLQAADKYQMKDLLDVLLHIIWCMPLSWFSADVAIKLYFFAKKAGKDLNQAEKKGWAVLRWYADKYPEKLIGSKESVHLCENPRAVMEFIVFLLKKYKD